MRRSTVYMLALTAVSCVLIGDRIGHIRQQAEPPKPDYEAAHAALAEWTRTRGLIDLQCGVDAGCVVEELVLVGVGCGPEGDTMVARQEDEFPVNCEAIEARWIRALDERGL